MLSIEGYRVVIGAFYLRLGHRVYKSSTTFCSKYVVKHQAFHFSVLLRLFMYIILLQTLQMNLDYALVTASKLTEEGIEINPGLENSNWNYAIKKLVQASHHQGNSKFEESAWMQCTNNAYFAIFSAIKSIEIWKTFDLDYILEQGENIFKQVGVYQPLTVDELPNDISIEGTHVSAKMLAHESNVFVGKENLFENYRHYDSTEKGNGAIFTCADFSVAVLWSQHYVYVFDSYSRNSSGFHDSNGKAVLLKFCSINSLNNDLKSFYYSMISIDTQYDLKYVGTEIDLNRRNEINCKLQCKHKVLYNRNHSSKKEIKMKNAKQKIYYEENKDKILDSKKVYYQKNVNTQKKAYYTQDTKESLLYRKCR